MSEDLATAERVSLSSQPAQKLEPFSFRAIDRHPLLIILNINNRRLGLPSRSPTMEQDIALTMRAVLELRQEQEGHDPAEKSSTSPDEPALACYVSSLLG